MMPTPMPPPPPSCQAKSGVLTIVPRAMKSTAMKRNERLTCV